MSLESVKDYYANLFIQQYRYKPRARAWIKATIDALMLKGEMLKLQDLFFLNNAPGWFLDQIGKYVGVDRSYWQQPEDDDYFTLDGNETQSFDNGRFIDDAGFVSSYNQLTDNYYKDLIKLKIALNNSNGSFESIDFILQQFFGDDVVLSSYDFHLDYIVKSKRLSKLLSIAIQKKILPSPHGICVRVFRITNEPFFAFNTRFGFDIGVFI